MKRDLLNPIASPLVVLAIALTGAACNYAPRRTLAASLPQPVPVASAPGEVPPPTVPQPVPLTGKITAIGHQCRSFNLAGPEEIADVFPELMKADQSRAAMSLSCPAEASTQGPVPVEAVYVGDQRTYYDNNGIIDEALSILFVRRDRPGMIAVAKVDPAAHLLPNNPMPDRPSDEELDKGGGWISQRHTYDLLAYGRQHPGAADYFLLGAFSDACTQPIKVRITDPRGPLPLEPDDLDLKTAEPGSETPPESRGVAARLAWLEGRVWVTGAFRVAAGAAKDPPPFASIVVAYLRPTGGILMGQVLVPHTRKRRDLVGSFQLPVAGLLRSAGEVTAGKYALFAFVGNEAAPVQVFKLE